MFQKHGKRLLAFAATLIASTLLVIPILQIWSILARIPAQLNPPLHTIQRIDIVATSPHLTVFAPVGYASSSEMQTWLDTAEARRAGMLTYLGTPEKNQTISVYVDPTRTIYEGTKFDTILVGDIKNGAGCVAHEMLHTFESPSNSFFNEGFAEHIEGKYGWGECNLTTVHLRDSELYSFLRSRVAFVPLASMMQTRVMRFDSPDTYLRYSEAGSFVDFLVARNGVERFLQFFHSNAFSDEALEAAMQQHFGMGLNALEQEWLANLRAANVYQTILFSVLVLCLLALSIPWMQYGRLYLPAVLLGMLALVFWNSIWFYPAEIVFTVLAALILGKLVSLWRMRVGIVLTLAIGIPSLTVWLVLPTLALTAGR